MDGERGRVRSDGCRLLRDLLLLPLLGELADLDPAGVDGNEVASGDLDVQPGSEELGVALGLEASLVNESGSPRGAVVGAPWCTICRAEAPGVAEVAAKLEASGSLVVLLGSRAVPRSPP